MSRNAIAKSASITAALAIAGTALLGVTPANAATNRSQIVAAAHGQLGNGCSSGYDGIPCNLNWCAAFATWAWGQGGVDVSKLGWTVTTFVNYGDNNGTWHDPGSGYVPQPGDAMIFGGSGYPTKASGGAHVGIVERVNADSTITEIGGNQSGSVTEVTGTADSIEHNLEGSNYNFLGYVSPVGAAPAIPAGFNVELWGFNSGQTLSRTVNLTAHPTQSGVINWLDYVIDGQNHTYGGGSFTANNNAVLAKNSIGLYGWTKESDPLETAQATGGGVQMILDDDGVVWAKSSIGLYGWTKESDAGVKAIAVGSDGTQMIIDSTGRALAKNGIGLYGWTQESDPGVTAISTNGGTQMIIDSTGRVLAKNSIGLYGWTQESDPGVKAIAVGSDGTQMIIDSAGRVLAKNSIGLYGWTQESDPGVKAIAVGSDGTQMIIDSADRVLAKNSIGLYGWTQESDPGVKAISTNAGVQMILNNDGTVYAKNGIGLYNWTKETDALIKAIAVGSDGTQMILGQ
ncbi:CHAP domain-containing protein [Kitasatospora cinereorecta]|uniref:CHAP domain-containing protein n=1 Tax=Kitasatospora cinereorecta TaxID=285560 RepID=A0ABW0VBB9_9ACTN